MWPPYETASLDPLRILQAETRRNFLRHRQILALEHGLYLPGHDGRGWAAAFDAALALPEGPPRDEAVRAVGDRYFREYRAHSNAPGTRGWRWSSAL